MKSFLVVLLCAVLCGVLLSSGSHNLSSAFMLNNQNADKWSLDADRQQSLTHGVVRNKRALFGGPSGDSGLELCKIFKNKIALGAVEDVCQRCVELFQTPDLHKQCRAKCFDNEIFEECARVVLREEMISERQLYL